MCTWNSSLLFLLLSAFILYVWNLSPCFFHPSLFPRSLPAPGTPPYSFHSYLVSLRITETLTCSSHLVSPNLVQKLKGGHRPPYETKISVTRPCSKKKSTVTGKRCSTLHEWYSRANSSGYFKIGRTAKGCVTTTISPWRILTAIRHSL